MKIIDCDWTKRNGNGHSTCHLCNTLSWDSFCYDFELKILDKELFNTVLCGDCISKIKRELECKMTSNEEVEDKEYEDIEEFKEYKLINTRDILELEMIINKINADYNYKINALIRNQKYILERLDKND